MSKIFLAALGGLALAAGSVSADPPAQPPPLVDFLLAARKDGGSWARAGLQWLGEREATGRFLGLVAPPVPGKPRTWSKPTQTVYNWAWMADRLDADQDGAVSAAEFSGPTAWFSVLDRDRDGRLTSADLNWNDDAPLAKASSQAKSLFGSIDADGNGRVTPEEWDAFYKKLNQGKDYLAQDDLLPLFLSGDKGRAGGLGGKGRNDALRAAQLKAFFDGDVGSWREGPDLGARAPDFTLASPDGARKITLSQSFGKRPVVLVFGSFT